MGKSARQLRLVALGVVVKRPHLPSLDQAERHREISFPTSLSSQTNPICRQGNFRVGVPGRLVVVLVQAIL